CDKPHFQFCQPCSTCAPPDRCLAIRLLLPFCERSTFFQLGRLARFRTRHSRDGRRIHRRSIRRLAGRACADVALSSAAPSSVSPCITPSTNFAPAHLGMFVALAGSLRTHTHSV